MRILLISGIFLTLGVISIFGNELHSFRLIAGAVTIAMSLFYGIQLAFSSSANSKHAALFRITDKSLEIRSYYLGPLITLQWQEIRSIKLNAAKLTFDLKGKKRSILFGASSSRAKELKKFLSESAKQHSIKFLED